MTQLAYFKGTVDNYLIRFLKFIKGVLGSWNWNASLVEWFAFMQNTIRLLVVKVWET